MRIAVPSGSVREGFYRVGIEVDPDTVTYFEAAEEDLAFVPVPVIGEPVSETVIRERR
jgi:hypothetical protein